MKNPILLCLILLLSNLMQAQDAMKSYADNLAKKYLDGHPGSLVIGIQDQDKQQIYFYGETTAGNKIKPDSNSIYETGAISETFVSILFAALTVKGIIQSDDKLKNLLPVEVPAPIYRQIICKPVKDTHHRPGSTTRDEPVQFTPYTCFPDSSSKPQEIMLCDLATHTTGLPEYPFNLNLRTYRLNPESMYTTDNLYYFLKNYRFDKPLSYDYNYSSLGISILAHAMSYKMKTDYDSLLAQYVTGPLHMTKSRVILSNEERRKLVTGYTDDKQPAFTRKPDIFAPAVSFHVSVADMMKFLHANIQQSKMEINHVLDYTHNSRILLSGSNHRDESIALGWKINKISNEKYMVWQHGLTSGFASFIGFVESNHQGVFLISSYSQDLTTWGTDLLNQITTQ